MVGYAEHAHWGYGENNGPDKWGSLNSDYALCQTGANQSPVNIQSGLAKKVDASLSFGYAVASKNIINNGHTVQVNFKKNANSIKFKGVTYKLIQTHFHTPSENQIDSKVYPLEAHLVHQNDKGELLVIGVLFNAGEENKELEKIIKAAPKNKSTERVLEGVNPLNLLPKKRSFYHFTGSLTTPPCSENVQWLVLKEQLSASERQIAVLQKAEGKNARPTQALNEREIFITR